MRGGVCVCVCGGGGLRPGSSCAASQFDALVVSFRVRESSSFSLWVLNDEPLLAHGAGQKQKRTHIVKPWGPMIV